MASNLVGGRLPADDAVTRIMSSMEFAMKLQPLPALPSGKKSKKRSAAASSGSDESERRVKGKGGAKKKALKIKQGKEDLEALRKELRELRAAAGGDGKAASKGKLKSTGISAEEVDWWRGKHTGWTSLVFRFQLGNFQRS